MIFPNITGNDVYGNVCVCGDIMSFYLDNQLQETFTQLARQTNNLYELAYMFGYKT